MHTPHTHTHRGMQQRTLTHVRKHTYAHKLTHTHKRAHINEHTQAHKNTHTGTQKHTRKHTRARIQTNYNAAGIGVLFSQEVLDSGYSHEVEECRASEWFRCMEVGWWWAYLVHRRIFPNESAIRPGTRLLCDVCFSTSCSHRCTGVGVPRPAAGSRGACGVWRTLLAALTSL